MKLAYHLGRESLKNDSDFVTMADTLSRSGFTLTRYSPGMQADILLSVGGDGTYLDSARFALEDGIPVLGVNFGRLGFLSENRPDEIVAAMQSGNYSIEQRTVLEMTASDGKKALAINEVSLHRTGAAMLGVQVKISGSTLPAYWGDGVLVSTSSGSTAYNLSAGGPICLPSAQVLIVSPIAPHNLNVRPLLISEDEPVEMILRTRDESAILSADNVAMSVDSGTEVHICKASLRLKAVRLSTSNFIYALKTRLHWGEDVRNSDKL